MRRERAARDERPLGVARDRLRVGSGERELAEDVVERPDRARQKCARTCEEVALDPLDVRSAWHDQHRIAVDRLEVPLEQAGDLAGLRRPDDECQPHRPIVVVGSRRLSVAKSAKSGKWRTLAR